MGDMALPGQTVTVIKELCRLDALNKADTSPQESQQKARRKLYACCQLIQSASQACTMNQFGDALSCCQLWICQECARGHSVTTGVMPLSIMCLVSEYSSAIPDGLVWQ